MDSDNGSTPSPFLWVIRVLASLFLLGYLTFGFLTVFTFRDFPGESFLENIVFISLALIFLVGLYFLWSNREGLAGGLFILWYAALWGCEIYTHEEYFMDLPAPGTFLFIIGVLSLIYWINKKKRNKVKN